MSHGIMIHVIIFSNYFTVSPWFHQFDGKFAWRHKFYAVRAEPVKKKGSQLSENKKAELRTNNERKKCRNTQNIFREN